MTNLYSHGNRNVSKVWFVVLFAWAMLVVVFWKTFVTIQDIEARTEKSQGLVDDIITAR
ncbi:hypothetical protein L0Y40_01735 [Candidatus Wolfebacteria bacterium]|nr:hypothetical protein [Candidatus Wolfebacteria bacterium]